MEEGSTVAEVRALMAQRYPAMEKYLGRTAFAVNREYVREEQVLRDGDELAAIPPVSGG
jgi:molybdopterin converting factor small subunit